MLIIYILLYKVGQTLDMPPIYYVLVTLGVVWEFVKDLVAIAQKYSKK